MAVLLFFLPGITLIFSDSFKKRGLSFAVAFAAAYSVAFFFGSFLVLKLFGISVTGFTCVVLLASTILLLADLNKMRLNEFVADRTEGILLIAVIVLLILRIAPMWLQPLPSGTEAAKLASYARTISDFDRISSGVPFVSAGYSAFVAAISLISGWDLNSCGFFFSCFSFVLLAVCLFTFLCGFFRRSVAAAAAMLATFATAYPQNLISSGRVDAVCALSFAALFLTVLLNLRKTKLRSRLLLSVFPVAAVLSSDVSLVTGRHALFLLLIPGAFLLALALRAAWRSRLFWAIVIALCVFNYLVVYLHGSVAGQNVGDSDLAAYKWIGDTIGGGATFLVNDSDAGIWIPAKTGRGAVRYSDSSRSTKFSYIYVGSIAVGRRDLDPARLESRPRRYRRVYSNGGAQVWKVL